MEAISSRCSMISPRLVRLGLLHPPPKAGGAVTTATNSSMARSVAAGFGDVQGDLDANVRRRFRRSSHPKGVSVLSKVRGFAAMDHARLREVARKGGRAAHEKGRAHEWTPEE